MCPLQTERLASIRLFPNPELDQEQFKIAQEDLIFAESIVIKDERYLPISELDLRVLNSEIISSMCVHDMLCGTNFGFRRYMRSSTYAFTKDQSRIPNFTIHYDKEQQQINNK